MRQGGLQASACHLTHEQPAVAWHDLVQCSAPGGTDASQSQRHEMAAAAWCADVMHMSSYSSNSCSLR